MKAATTQLRLGCYGYDCGVDADGIPIREKSLAEVLGALRDGAFDQLIGVPETAEVEFKQGPYSFVSTKDKLEFAKDVSSMLNTRGGIIVMGVRQGKSQRVSTDIAASLNPFKLALVNTTQYDALANAHIHPAPSGVNVELFPDSNDDTCGYAVIHVPQGPEALWPFLIKKSLDEDGGKLPTWLFGFAQRGVGNTRLEEIQDLHKLLTLGRVFDGELADIRSELSRLATVVEQNGIPQKADSPLDASSLIEVLVGDLPNEAHLKPYLVLTAAPSGKVEIESFSQREGVRAMLESPKPLRDAGWNLVTLRRVTNRSGPSLVATDYLRKSIGLQRNGVFATVATFEGFLEHGPWQTSEFIANSHAVVEFVYEFVAFYDRVLKEYVDQPPKVIRFSVGIRNGIFGEPAHHLKFSPGVIHDFFSHDAVRLQDSNFSDDLDVDCAAVAGDGSQLLDVGRIGYQLLESLYHHFNLTSDDIPYSTGEAPPQIDPDQIRRAG